MVPAPWKQGGATQSRSSKMLYIPPKKKMKKQRFVLGFSMFFRVFWFGCSKVFILKKRVFSYQTTRCLMVSGARRRDPFFALKTQRK